MDAWPNGLGYDLPRGSPYRNGDRTIYKLIKNPAVETFNSGDCPRALPIPFYRRLRELPDEKNRATSGARRM